MKKAIFIFLFVVIAFISFRSDAGNYAQTPGMQPVGFPWRAYPGQYFYGVPPMYQNYGYYNSCTQVQWQTVTANMCGTQWVANWWMATPVQVCGLQTWSYYTLVNVCNGYGAGYYPGYGYGYPAYGYPGYGYGYRGYGYGYRGGYRPGYPGYRPGYPGYRPGFGGPRPTPYR